MYSKAIVTFIDILGFQDLVQNEQANWINTILDVFTTALSPLDGYKYIDTRNDKPEVISFSDSIVRIRRIDVEDNKKNPQGLLFQELINLIHAQIELIKYGITIRGGMTIGDIYMSEGQVFGPGLIKAYELESNHALYPRIIIDPLLIAEHKTNSLLKADWHTFEQEHEMFKNLIKQGDDGMWFIDYVAGSRTEFDESGMYPIFLRRHREVIIDTAKKHSKLNSVLSKFTWLANYHNQVISNMSDEEIEDYNINKEELIITSKDIPTLQYLKS